MNALKQLFLQSSDMAEVATSGDYSDLVGTPTIPSSAAAVHAEPEGLSTDTKTSLKATYVASPETVRSASIYVHASGQNSDTGRDWGKAKQTIASAITALGADGGVVELGAGTHTVSSTGRFDTCTFTASSDVVTNPSITANDAGSYIISTYLRSPLLIANVVPGVSFKLTDETGRSIQSEAAGTAPSIITKPGIVVPPGVLLRGRGGQWTNNQSAQDSVLNRSNTLIQDNGTGITILFGHPNDFGASNSGQNAVGGELEDLTVKGNASNIFGIAQINNWGVIGRAVDAVGHGLGGLLYSGNANMTRFADGRFSGNGKVTNTQVGGGVVHLINTPEIPFGPVKFDNCFFTNNYGWNIAGTTDFQTVLGARSVRVDQGQFNHALASAATNSGTHAAISGRENRSLLLDCIFESADLLNLDVYDGPVTAIACKLLATGRATGGPLPYQVRINAAAALHAIGCGFHASTAYHVRVETGGIFNWSSCISPSTTAHLAADAAGNRLAPGGDAGLPAGSTATPFEPLVGLAGRSRANETFSRLAINSASLAITSQQMNFTYFTATKSSVATQVQVDVGATPSGGYATYIGLGVYFINSDGSLTLLASTTGANNNAFQSANQAITLNLAASVPITAGLRYVIGLLVNSTNALPTFRGAQTFALAPSANPALCQIMTGQTGLPASVPTSAFAAGGVPIYARLV